MNAGSPAPIRVLPGAVVARIAAGEVITRPLSVVRELLDNAIDAGATEIAVEIASGGYDLVAVHDNGSGIPRSDAALLCVRHATSKLVSDDLHSLTTLGFRGEALASIAAVADIEIRTRHRDEAAGTRLVACCGKSEFSSISRRGGTSVEVTRLFTHYPVRRSSAEPGREQPAIQRWIAHEALVHSHIAMSLSTDGRDTLRTTGTSLAAAAEEVLGAAVARRLVPFGPLDVENATVHGLIGVPSLHRARRDQVVVAVNGRLADVPEIARAIDRVWAEVLPRRRFPYVILLLTVSADDVDVNVHPAKEQVAIAGATRIAAALERELRRELGRTMHEPSEGLRLTLAASDLPGLRAAESGLPYGSGIGWGTLTVEAGALPRLRIIGQLDDTLIVCESELGTLLIDQHRAHERVIFDQLTVLAVHSYHPPVAVRLQERLAQLALDRMDELDAAGWDVHALPNGACEVRQSPDGFEPSDLPGVLEQATMDEGHSVLAAAACHAAIRKRRAISPDAAYDLVAALTATTQPTTCPHGQPIVLRLDRRFLERQFAWR